MDLDAHGSEVTFLELARDVAFDKGSLADATVADEHDLKGRNILRLSSHEEGRTGGDCLCGRRRLKEGSRRGG